MKKNRAKISRRSFLKGLSSAGIGLGCSGSLASLAKKSSATGTLSALYDASVFTACDMCFNRCGVIARVSASGGTRRVVKLDPNPHCSKSRGMLCARGNSGLDHLVNPDRLTSPLLRVGKRGEGKWKTIGWDEALDLAATKMRDIGAKYSRCGMLFTAGADTHSQFVHRFAEGYGSFNITTHESLCLLSGNRAFMDTYGEVPQPDVLNCDYIIMLGANRFESMVMPDTADLMQAKKRGAYLVTLDPRCTKTAELSNEWYAIRPATDMAFLLAVAHVILKEGLHDKAWVEANTNGLEQLKAHVARYSPEWAEGETGIPAGNIRAIARGLAAAAPRAMIYPGRRSSDYKDATQIRRAFAIVNALLANYDQKGGLMGSVPVKLKGFPHEAPWYDDNPEDRVDANMVPLLFGEEGSFVLTREAVLSGTPYPIKGWFVYKTNPMGTAPDRSRTMRMMEVLDFVVTMDIFMSDTAFMSDLVLPSVSYLERNDPLFVQQGGPAGPSVMTRNQVVPPPKGCRPLFDVVKDLAQRLELEGIFDFTLEELREHQRESLPGLRESLALRGVFEPEAKLYGVREGQPFKTPSGKIELYSSFYEQKGLDPMPVYTPPQPAPSDSFLLVAGRNACLTQTQSQNNTYLYELVPSNTLWLHPSAAKNIGINNGDTVVVASEAGVQELKAELVPGIRPDTVYMHSGFGGISSGQRLVQGNGASISALLQSDYDQICGNAAIHTTHVRVKRKGDSV